MTPPFYIYHGLKRVVQKRQLAKKADQLCKTHIGTKVGEAFAELSVRYAIEAGLLKNRHVRTVKAWKREAEGQS